ncbi:MAG: nucleoside triphosphate pyrophosphohydrolase [Dehalococcoidia bacterium]|nr:nucleoside triphosphate pyrophosphohydrolase [Dehalococcoidia bacterium]
MTTNVSGFEELVRIVSQLRGPGGCPWDKEQTHASLKRNLLEECYEALEAIDDDSPDKLSEELGDVLVQIVFHAQIASEAGSFQMADVVEKIRDKLVRRHPHVFGDVSASDAGEVERNWEQLKALEGNRKSATDGIPAGLPALAHAQLLQDRVSRRGFEWEDISGVIDKVSEEVEELRAASTPEEREQELGDLLFSVVNLARWVGIQAEDSLRRTNNRFRARYTAMEEMAAREGLDFEQLPLERKEELWQRAKRAGS